MAERPHLLELHDEGWMHDGVTWRPPRDLYAVIGRPVAGSFSPDMHNAAFAATGIDADYVRLDVGAEQVGDLATRAFGLGLRGGSVTVPHKEAVAAICATLTPEAERLGAVNAVTIGADGWHGHNTDLGGLADVLGDDGVGAGWRGLVLGAGGAARAAAAALADRGAASVDVICRNGPGRERTALWLDGGAVPRASLAPWRRPDVDPDTPTVAVVCVPGGVDAAEVLPSRSDTAPSILLDLRYGVASAAGPDGWTLRDGMGLLLAQGVRAFSWWFGKDAPRTLMAEALARR